MIPLDSPLFLTKRLSVNGLATQNGPCAQLNVKRLSELLLTTAILAFPFAAVEADTPDQPPAQLNDGFRTATSEEIGLDREALETMTELLQRDVYPNVHAVLIQKDGRLLYEEYFEGMDGRWDEALEWETVELKFDREMLHQTRSVTKSITSAVVGLAIADDAIESVDEPIFQYFPEHADKVTNDKDQITLEHLLTMSAGLEWNEEDVPYTSPDNDEIRMDDSEDPTGYVLARALVDEPGSTYYYNGGLPVLSGFIVSRATGESFADFARTRLFEPLEINDLEWGGCCAWDEIPEMKWKSDKPWARFVNPAGQLWIRPRDLLKFGSLYLDQGRWNGKQILPAEWVARSLEPHIPQRYPVLEHGAGVTSRRAYGYFWWHLQYKLPYGEFTVHAAFGNGGQRIWVVPSLDLVVVHMTGNYNGTGSSWQAERLLLERILPWARNVDTDYEHEPGIHVHPLEPGEWTSVDIKPDAYVGDWEENGDPVPIRNEAGNLLMTRDGDSDWSLLPESTSVFAFGRVVDGVPASLLWKDYRLVFIPDENGNFNRYEIRQIDGELAVLEGARFNPTGSP